MRKNKTEDRCEGYLFHVINIILTAAFFVFTAVFLIVAERPEFSEIERRPLAKMPTFSAKLYFSGDYTKGLAEYYNDTVPLRDSFKTLSARFKGLFGITFNNAEFYFDSAVLESLPGTGSVLPDETVSDTTTAVQTELQNAQNELQSESQTEAVTSASNASSETDASDDITEEAEIEISNNIFVLYIDGHWRAMPRFSGGSGSIYANSLNAYKKELGQSVDVYSMIVPTQEEFYLPAKYSDYAAKHLETIISINEKLDGVVDVDAYSVLSEHKNEEIYARTDHHWLPLGAYYAAKRFAETANVSFFDISAYEKVEVDNYLGTLYGQTESPKLLGDPEVFTYYKPPNNYRAYYYTTDYTFEYTFPLFVEQPVSQSYSTFMGGDNKIVRIETDAANGRKLAIWKDSYGNALVPFLTGSFEEIFVLDIRYFKLNAIEFMKEHEITDVLFTMCTFTAADNAKAKFLDENKTLSEGN